MQNLLDTTVAIPVCTLTAATFNQAQRLKGVSNIDEVKVVDGLLLKRQSGTLSEILGMVDREKCIHFPPLCGLIRPIARLLRSLGRKPVYRVDAVIDARLITSIPTPGCGHPGCRLRPR